MSAQANKAIRELMTLTGATSVRQALGTVASWKAAEVAYWKADSQVLNLVLNGMLEEPICWGSPGEPTPQEAAQHILAAIKSMPQRVVDLEAQLKRIQQQAIWFDVWGPYGGDLGNIVCAPPAEGCTQSQCLAAGGVWHDTDPMVFASFAEAEAAVAKAPPWWTRPAWLSAPAPERAQGEAGAARKDRPTPWVLGWAEEAF